MNSLLFTTPSVIISFVMLVAMILLSWGGNSFARYRTQKNPEVFSDGDNSMVGSLLGLLALLLAFSFSMAASRYELRWQLVTDEANAIGTAILRADLYPDSIRKVLRGDFQQYVEARVAFGEAKTIEGAMTALSNSNDISTRIWNTVTIQSKELDNIIISNQMIPAVNAMIDIVTSRYSAAESHVPEPILWLLLVLCLAASFMVGYGRKGKKMDWIVVSGFAIMTVVTVFFIFDLDRPRRGIIKLDKAQHYIVDLRKMF